MSNNSEPTTTKINEEVNEKSEVEKQDIETTKEKKQDTNEEQQPKTESKVEENVADAENPTVDTNQAPSKISETFGPF